MVRCSASILPEHIDGKSTHTRHDKGLLPAQTTTGGGVVPTFQSGSPRLYNDGTRDYVEVGWNVTDPAATSLVVQTSSDGVSGWFAVAQAYSPNISTGRALIPDTTRAYFRLGTIDSGANFLNYSTAVLFEGTVTPPPASTGEAPIFLSFGAGPAGPNMSWNSPDPATTSVRVQANYGGGFADVDTQTGSSGSFYDDGQSSLASYRLQSYNGSTLLATSGIRSWKGSGSGAII